MDKTEDPILSQCREFVQRKFPLPQSYKSFELGMRWRWNFGIKIIDFYFSKISRGTEPLYEIGIHANKKPVIQWMVREYAFCTKAMGKRIIRTIQILLDKSDIDAELAQEIANTHGNSYRTSDYFDNVISHNLALVLKDIVNYSFKGFCRMTTSLDLTKADLDHLQSKKFLVHQDCQGYTDIDWSSNLDEEY